MAWAEEGEEREGKAELGVEDSLMRYESNGKRPRLVTASGFALHKSASVRALAER